ncbi:flavin reductase family protein [Acuticoccus sp. MNP-M23]|uniref:flavin reductase family protein n=1 Tax=Acuticoccus sp. MNP-M23 TaxID=3072793 RepID=UPI00281550B4|nr:flavin reductase family protein [Acuticoccus sp. MNP-M23]WMS43313.1 flavin reductase family protein [Acuticoccus sp. MNP-M23]
MQYDPRVNDHGLPHDPFKALVAPRPIGWISSLDAEGRPNLAPYSFFNAVCDHPHLVMFSSFGAKDSLSNVEATGEFVCNLATYDLREAMNRSSAPLEHGESEFAFAGLETAPSTLVKPPRVAATPVAMECVYVETVALKNAAGERGRYTMVLGEVVMIHIDESVLVDGMVDLTRLQPIARCGYRDYAATTTLFQMERPKG